MFMTQKELPIFFDGGGLEHILGFRFSVQARYFVVLLLEKVWLIDWGFHQSSLDILGMGMGKNSSFCPFLGLKRDKISFSPEKMTKNIFFTFVRNILVVKFIPKLSRVACILSLWICLLSILPPSDILFFYIRNQFIRHQGWDYKIFKKNSGLPNMSKQLLIYWNFKELVYTLIPCRKLYRYIVRCRSLSPEILILCILTL